MTTAGWLLVAGFVVFMAGAAAWDLAFQAPLGEALPVMHAARRRLRWIHRTMLVAMVLSSAGVGAVAGVADHPGAWAAVFAFGIGAVLWMGNLMFRLTVQEAVAESVAGGAPIPAIYAPLLEWAGMGHRVHMLTAYLSAVPLGWALAHRGLIPDWLGWAGAIWGALWALGLIVPRLRFAFEPPFWAHVYTFAVGIALLV